MAGALGSFFGRLFGKRGAAAGVGGIGGVGAFRPELLVFGLGNPGREYGGTRHNIGFEVIDGLRGALGGGVSPPEVFCGAECATAVCGAGRKPVAFVKPLTYMNLSGGAVSALVKKYGLSGADCLVVVDDFNIPLGKIRFRKGGSSGGHNGLKSITAAIGEDYPRLRIGIGPLPAGVAVIDFVLGRFGAGERETVSAAVGTASEAVMYMIENGVDPAMNRYN